MSSGTLPGLHHVTAIASNAQRNVDFYVGVLGLRLVKKTINYDDPGTYHLYYGDSLGTPGTILTFFPWPNAVKGRRGTGETSVTALAVPEGALPYWQERLQANGVTVSEIQSRFDEQYVSFEDPDGMGYELVARPEEGGDTTAIRRIEGVTLTLADSAKTEKLLTETLGFSRVTEESGRIRYVAGNGTGSFVDLVVNPELRRGSLGAGTVHHIAWRTPTDATQQEWLDTLTGLDYHASPVMDRQYFHSIYFREPGGVLFEIATDPPGFTADEALENLGTRLCLPTWLESQREQLEARLTPLTVPGGEAAVGV
jgi:glyoxalase family protein